MPFQHPQGPVSEWPQNFQNVLDDDPLILGCEEWRVIMGFWMFEHLAGEFS